MAEKMSNKQQDGSQARKQIAPKGVVERVEIYTDGACKGNPGPGGWGALLRCNGHERELYGGEADTTNNRMELMAAIQALESLTRHCKVDVTTDSVYVRSGITEWMANWKKRGWKTAARKPVKNVDLWKRLETAARQHDVAWHWVKGHSGHAENERADQLANLGIEQQGEPARGRPGPLEA